MIRSNMDQTENIHLIVPLLYDDQSIIYGYFNAI